MWNWWRKMDRFQLGWKLGTVGDCCTDAFTGKSPKYSKTKTEYRIIGQQANQRYGIDLRYVKYGTTEFGDAQEDRFFLRYNDVILNTLGTGSIGRSGIYKRREPILTDGHPFVFRTSEICLPDYLFHYLRYSEKQIIDSASGSTNQRFLKLKSFLLFPIPIPPIDEQERIVGRIEELFSQLDAGLETLKKTKAQLAVYRQAVLKEAFEGDYPRKQLKEFSKAISGFAFKSSRYSPDGKYIVVKIGNVKERHFDFSRDLTKTLEADDSILEKYLLQHGDCVITLTGSRGKRDYGFVAMVEDQSNYLLNQRVAVLRFDQSVALPEFFQYYLASPEYRDMFFSYETGNVGQGNVGIKALLDPYVILPDIDTQKRIVEEVEARLSVCDSIDQTIDMALQQAEAMRQSILKDAFEGRL